MVENNDWRLTNQMNYLFQKRLLHINYEAYRPGWSHDHCSFCSDVINNSDEKAYCTTDKYHWICENCFGDFCEMFEWEVEEITDEGNEN
ncbi:MAG: hypothetical protein FWE29_04935 [Defluviitaleaceae bacterium]|nr:hypothetical protein [Defluviitaleaceae bacterium]